MTKWEVLISLDERPHALVLDAHSARAALAQLARHRAAGVRNQGTQYNYATVEGSRVGIRWGSATAIAIGPITEIAALPDPTAAV